MGYIRCCSLCKRRTRKINIGSKLITFFTIKTRFDWLKIHHILSDIKRNLAGHNSLRRTDCRRQMFVFGFTLVWAFEGLSSFFLQFADIRLEFVTNARSVDVFFKQRLRCKEVAPKCLYYAIYLKLAMPREMAERNHRITMFYTVSSLFHSRNLVTLC